MHINVAINEKTRSQFQSTGNFFCINMNTAARRGIELVYDPFYNYTQVKAAGTTDCHCCGCFQHWLLGVINDTTR